jgi:hypothetical protein
MDNILTTIVSIAGGGGIVALINYLGSRRKNNADTHSVVIKDALSLESIAVERYKTAEEKLEMAEQLLKETRKELEAYKSYIGYLHTLLDQHGVKYEKHNAEELKK